MARPAGAEMPPRLRRQLLPHLALLSLILVASSWYVGFRGYFFIDEAALLAQVEVVQSGSWTVERPLADRDPAAAYVPMARSTVAGDHFAPFPNHPLHVLIASGADALGGRVGLRLLSVAGVVVASAASALLAGSLSSRHAVAAAWLTGICSPLVFDANLVVAHGLAAGVAGLWLVVVLAVARPTSKRSVAHAISLTVAVALLAGVGTLLRSEFFLLAGAVAIVATYHAFRCRSRPLFAVAGASATGAVTAYVLEPLWVASLTGATTGPKQISSVSRGGLSGALEGAWRVLIGSDRYLPTFLLVAAILAVMAAILLRTRSDEAGLAAVVAVVALGVGAAQWRSPMVASGLLVAFPLLAVGLTSVRRSDSLTSVLRGSLQVATLFGVLVLATQYRVGGGLEWGWRYFAVALPAVGAVLAVPLLRLYEEVRTAPARVAMLALGALSIVVPATGVSAQRDIVRDTSRLLSRVDEVFDRTGADMIVAAESSFGRYAWQRSIQGDVVTVPRTDAAVAQLLADLREAGVVRVLLVWHGERPTVSSTKYRATEAPHVLAEDVYEAQLLVAEPNTRSPT